jgi:hypothetical protein
MVELEMELYRLECWVQLYETVSFVF